jgi:hypothetical protein
VTIVYCGYHVFWFYCSGILLPHVKVTLAYCNKTKRHDSHNRLRSPLHEGGECQSNKTKRHDSHNRLRSPLHEGGECQR